MTLYRIALLVCATLVAAVLSPAAFAGCGGCCGGCGAGYAVTYVPAPSFAPPAFEYVQQIPPPVAPVPIALAPIGVGPWNSYGVGVGGCGGCGYRGLLNSGFFGYPPFYIVNQGPQYSGPGIMLPYLSYAPGEGLAAPGAYPYIGPPYGYVGHPGYRHAAYPGYGYAMRAHYYAHGVHRAWHRHYPLGVRG